mmetsp:Transcript_46865/g.124718  ORF Transcript_46865/g.124718 Transcript_46865/m.124718 type:complete len:307 (+) Transcript_46865:590-1510(+)
MANAASRRRKNAEESRSVNLVPIKTRKVLGTVFHGMHTTIQQSALSTRRTSCADSAHVRKKSARVRSLYRCSASVRILRSRRRPALTLLQPSSAGTICWFCHRATARRILSRFMCSWKPGPSPGAGMTNGEGGPWAGPDSQGGMATNPPGTACKRPDGSGGPVRFSLVWRTQSLAWSISPRKYRPTADTLGATESGTGRFRCAHSGPFDPVPGTGPPDGSSSSMSSRSDSSRPAACRQLVHVHPKQAASGAARRTNGPNTGDASSCFQFESPTRARCLQCMQSTNKPIPMTMLATTKPIVAPAITP